MNIILPRPRAHQMKKFAKMQWIIPPNLNRPRDKNDDCIGIGGWLNIGSFDGMFDGTDGFEFGDDLGGALDLLSFEC